MEGMHGVVLPLPLFSFTGNFFSWALPSSALSLRPKIITSSWAINLIQLFIAEWK
jgi:hypothetical protein